MSSNQISTLAVIPARGGSKGLPGKNLAKVGQHSLIGWAVITASQAFCVTRTVVSTDSAEIANEAALYGAEVPFLRPENLATDTANSVDVALHCLQIFQDTEGFFPEWLLLLQPTSPLRISKDIEAAFELIQDRDCQAVVSVSEPSQHPMLAKTLGSQGYIESLFSHKASRRQELPTAYQPNGAIYWIKVEALVRERTFYPERTLAYVMPMERSIDIDSSWDLELARFIST